MNAQIRASKVTTLVIRLVEEDTCYVKKIQVAKKGM